MSEGSIMLEQVRASPWIYDPVTKEYHLEIEGTVVAIIDQNGNLKIKGRVLKIAA